AVALDGNGKIVVAGTDGSVTDLYFARMDATASLDTTFNGTGIVKLPLGLTATVEDIAIQTNNAIVSVGSKGDNALIVRILENGTIDSAGFQPTDGYLAVDLDPAFGNSDALTRVKIKADGRIVASGYTANSPPTYAFSPPPTYANAIIQLTSAGALDTSFGASGIASYNYGTDSAKTNAMTFDSTERILTTGFNSNGSNDDIFIARVTTTGALDTNFNGATGGILFDYSNGTESATAIIYRADGTVVIAGSDDLNLFPTNFFFIQKFNLVEP
ncbi:MAG: hypothetical protein MJK04_00355, partial [Psychrosphaera sp.]|nr:hypothetical protein [Psychrosphaera sp.]